MKRKIDKISSENKPTATLISCIEDEYWYMSYIDSKVNSTERFIITDEGPVKRFEKLEGGGEKLIDVIEKLRNGYLTDDHNTTIVESDIHNFDKMMHTILMIVENRLKFVDTVYLNLTGGSGEFCSAAIMIGMGFERVKVVSISIKKKAMTDEEIKNTPGVKSIYSEMKEINEINGYEIELPNANLIRSLQIYNDTPRGKKTSTEVIRRLLEDGVWFELKDTARPEEGGDRTSLSIEKPKHKTDEEKLIVYKEKNFYQRNILGKWADNGWVKKNKQAAGGYEIADEGRRILSIFTGDINELNKYVLINEEKDRKKEEEREKQRVELLKTILDNSNKLDKNDE